MKQSLMYVLTAVLALLLWDSLLRLRIVSPAILASPLEVAAALPRFLQPADFLVDLLSTTFYSLWAFALSVPAGLLVGVLIWNAGPFRGPLRLALDFLRSIPVTALVPVLLLVVGVGTRTKLIAGALSGAFVMALSALIGLQASNTTRGVVADTLGLTGFRRFLLFSLPESLGELSVGARTSVSLCLVLVIVTEMLIGAQRGLGRVIADMRYTDDLGAVYAAIFWAGVVGFTLNRLIIGIERIVVPWRQRGV